MTTVAAAPATPRPHFAAEQPWPRRRLARVAWLQHRGTLVSVALLCAVGALAIGAAGIGVHRRYAAYLNAGCLTARPRDLVVCANAGNWVADHSVGFTALVVALRVLPVIVGVFVGAPLVSREIESGTFRFAWTQGVGRIRLVRSSFTLLALVVTAIAGFLGLLLGGWYAHELSVINPNVASPWQSGLFATTWWMLGSWTLLALALGAFLGAAVKRTVPAMAATGVALGGLLVASSALLLPLLGTGARVSSRFSIGQVNLGTVDEALRGRPSFWILRAWLSGPNGRVLSIGAADRIQVRAGATDNATQWLSRHHDTFWVSYQLSDRYWVYQGVEGVVVIVLAVVFVLATLRSVRGRARP